MQWPGIVIPVIDAKKEAFFCTLFKNGGRLCRDMDANPAEISAKIKAVLSEQPDTKNPDNILLTGPGARLLHEKLSTHNPPLPTPQRGIAAHLLPTRWGDAQTLLEIAKENNIFENNETDYFSGPEYIRKSDAELKLNP